MEASVTRPPMGYETVLRRVTYDYELKAVEVRTLYRFAGTGAWDPPYLVREESTWYDVDDLEEATEGDELVGKGVLRTREYDDRGDALCAFER